MGQIASRLKTPKGTVQNILEHYRDSGSVEPKPRNAGRKPAFAGKTLERLEHDVTRHPDATLAELRDRSGVQASVAAVHNALKRLGFTRKKNFMCERTTSSRGLAPIADRDGSASAGFSG